MAEVASQISETGLLITNDKSVKMYITDYNCKLNNISQQSYINGCQIKRDENKENESNREVSSSPCASVYVLIKVETPVDDTRLVMVRVSICSFFILNTELKGIISVFWGKNDNERPIIIFV